MGQLGELVQDGLSGDKQAAADALAVPILAHDQVLGEAAVGRWHIAEDAAAEHHAALLGDDHTELAVRRWLGEKCLDAVELEDRVGVGKRGLQQPGQRRQGGVVGIVKRRSVISGAAT